MSQSNFFILKISVPLWKKLSEILTEIRGRTLFKLVAEEYEKLNWTKLAIFHITGGIFVLGLDNEKKILNKNEYNDSKFLEDLLMLKSMIDRIDFTYAFEGVKNVRLSEKYTLQEYKHIEFNISHDSSREWRNTIKIPVEIPNFFDIADIKRDHSYPISIANIYDPSKFWIRFASVDVLQDKLFKFYNKQQELLTIPTDFVQINMNCLVLLEGIYYRCRIIKINIETVEYFKVFLHDYGSIVEVHTSQLFLLTDEFCETPSLSVRAMLTNVSPLDNNMWSCETYDRFSEMLHEPFYLAHVVHIHKERRVLEINLFDFKTVKQNKFVSINYRLISEGLAKIAWHDRTDGNENEQFKVSKKNLYLYPTFEMIENAIAPSNPYLTEELKQCVPWDVLFPGLYEYQG